MRRNRRTRRTTNQPGPSRSQQQQSRRRGRHRPDQTTPATPSAALTTPLRRSARLSQRNTIADRATESESVREQRRETRHVQESRREPENGNPENDIERGTENSIRIPQTEDMNSIGNPNHFTNNGLERTYALEIAIQPPRVAKVGVALYPPLAIKVHIRDAASGAEISGEDELNNLFAQATLYRESGEPPALAPPDMFLLSGRLSRSLDLLNEVRGGNGITPESSGLAVPLNEQQGSYALFPDLTINRVGNYRLGVSLFKVCDMRRICAVSVTSSGQGGGRSLEEVKSDVIMVQPDAVPVQIGADAQEFLNHLRERGAVVPSPSS